MHDILLVEDDLQIIEFITELLTDAGYTIQTALNGKEALAMIEQQQPKLVLLDLLMPEADGYDVLETLVHRNHQALTVVILTANQVDEADLKQRGAHAVLCKPFQIDDLLTLVDRLIQR